MKGVENPQQQTKQMGSSEESLPVVSDVLANLGVDFVLGV
jgi:hypothetical protein